MASINFIGALKTLKEAIPLIGQIAIMVTVIGLVVGVIVEVATDGSISVFSAMGTFLNTTWVADVVIFFTSLSTGVKLALSLISLVVILILFAKYLKGDKKGSAM